MADAVSTKIEKLSTKNYTHWKIVMSSLLKSKGLWEFCTENSLMHREDEDEQSDKDIAKIIQKDEEAKHLLYVSMDASQLTATGMCDTAFELWTKIRENNEGAEVTLRSSALADFLSLRYNKCESIVAYCGRYELALGRLESTSYLADEQMKLWVFRNHLPKDIKQTVDTWTMTHIDGKVTELISQLKLQYHMDKTDNREDITAFYTPENYDDAKNSNKHWPGTSNQARKSEPSKNKPQHGRQSTGIECNYCKKKGHMWRDCRKRKSDDAQKRNHTNNNQNTQQNAFIALNTNSNNQQLSLNEDSWIVDSGATSHMTPHKDFFRSYQTFEEPRMVLLGDGKHTAAHGEGTIKFKSNEFHGELQAVLWVPELTENLFSVGKAMDQGYEVNFSIDPPQVSFNKDGSTRLKGFQFDRRLFIIELTALGKKTVSEKAYTGVPIETWHKRLGHCSIDSVKKLMKKNAVNGLKINQTKERCTDCVVGKICRAHHPSKNHTQATDTVAVLHIDTCGPFSTPSIGNSRYFVLAVEEHSDYKIIRFVRSKAEISNMVKEIINYVELNSRPVKMIVTDQGTEYVNRELDSWLADKGVIHDTSATYTPEQNGKVERANRSIIEGVRTLLAGCNFTDTETIERLWAEAANTVTYITNFLLSSRQPDKTRYELFHRKKPDVSHLRTFGERAIVRIPNSHRESKLVSKDEEARFVGYTDRSNTYRFYTIEGNQIITTRDAVFTQDDASQKRQIEEFEISILNNKRPSQTVRKPFGSDSEQENTGSLHEEDAIICEQGMSQIDQNTNSLTDDELESQRSALTEDEETEEQSSDSELPPARSTRSTKNLTSTPLRTLAKSCEEKLDKRERALFTLDDGPLTTKNAKESQDWLKWQTAIDKGTQALNKNDTWKIMDRPQESKPIKNKLVLKVESDKSNKTLNLLQPLYVDKELDSFQMINCRPASTTREVGAKQEEPTPLTQEYRFKELVGSLLHLVTCARPDITHAVGTASRTSQPTQAHWIALKRILHYLTGPKEVGIRFRWEKSTDLVGYCDADYANDTETRRSTSGAWHSQIQPIVTRSTTGAEYMSGYELSPIREHLIELKQINEDKPTTVLINHQSTTKTVTNGADQQRTKHIDVREKWLKDQVADKKLTVKHISGDQQIADILTKPLNRTKFRTSRSMIMAMALVMLMVGAINCTEPIRIGPLHFKESKKPYLGQDIHYTARIRHPEKCGSLFSGVAFSGGRTNSLETIVEKCREYHRRTLESIEGCEALSEPPKQPTNTSGTSVFYLIGVGTKIEAKKEGLSADQLEAEQYQQQEQKNKFAELMIKYRDSLPTSNKPDERITALIKDLGPVIERQPGQISTWIKAYQDHYDEQRLLLENLSKDMKEKKITPMMNKISREPLWEEPAEKWSTIRSCHRWTDGNDSVIEVNFAVPMIDHSIKIMEAVSIDHWNMKKSKLCWMKYGGPRHIMVNTTNNCMTDFKLSPGETSARSFSCEGPEDDRLSEVDYWKPDFCSDHATLNKDYIQDKVIHGLHKIYCYPWNMTIEGKHQPCPDHPFELETTVNFKLANIEHKGQPDNEELISSTEAHISKELATKMRSDPASLSISATNSTGLGASISKLVENIRDIPKFPLAKMYESPRRFLTELWDEVVSYAEHIGATIGIISILFILVLIMPIVQIIILMFKIIGKSFTTWNRLISKASAYLASTTIPKKEQRKLYANKLKTAWQEAALKRRVLGAGGSVAARMRMLRASEMKLPLMGAAHDLEA